MRRRLPAILRRTAAVFAVTAVATPAAPTANAQVCTDFEPPAAGAPWPCCLVCFSYDGIGMETRAFRWTDGTPTADGEALPRPACNGGEGASLAVHNVNVAVYIGDFFPPYSAVKEISFFFKDDGGSVNLRVNGQWEFTYDDFAAIPGNTFVGVGVLYNVNLTGPNEGIVTLTALPRECIDQLWIGGQELCIDDLCARDPCGCLADVDGDGDTDVSDLAMLLAAYGSVPGGPNWNPACDFDADNDVDVSDLAFLLSDYGCVP